MATPDNIARFDQHTGQVFALLYENFPVPVLLKAADFVDTHLVHNEHLGGDVASPESEFFSHTVAWLKRAGYIDVQELDPRHLYTRGAVLTVKGLEVLNVQPDNLSKSLSLGERIYTAAKTEGSDMLRSLVREALSIGARMMLHNS